MELHLGALPGNYESGETFSEVLSFNHFGTPTIPPRPVLRIAAEKIIPKNKNRIQAYLHNLIVNPKDSKRLETVLLTTLGQQSIAEAKRIIDGNTELIENAPATIAKKGFNLPLYETGELEKHLGFEITD
ncbi:MAG: hypothetical protein PHN88_15890 [Ignavibacteria bacterium]|nr:hypothetical protein [Ignavibacteria bacterium]